MGRPKNYDRDQVIDEAMGVFWLKGYAATSMSDLTEVTGLNKKSLYNEFGSKEALFQAALQRYSERRSPLAHLLMRQPYGRQNIVDYLEGLASDSSRRGCLLSLSIHERSTLEDEASQKVRDDFRGLTRLFELNLRSYVDGGDESIRARALLLSSQMFSVAGMGKLGFSKSQVKAAIDVLLEQSNA